MPKLILVRGVPGSGKTTFARNNYPGVVDDAGKPDKNAAYMVSADDFPTAQRHWSLGNRTFRVIQDVKEVVKDKEILCPASKERGRRVQCSSCMLCGGSEVKAKSIAIVQH